MGLWEGFTFPTVPVALAFLVGFVLIDTSFDFGAKNLKAAQSYHTKQQATEPLSAYQDDLPSFLQDSAATFSGYDVVTLGVTVASIVFAFVNSGFSWGTFDELSTPVICVVTCVFRRFRITPSIKQLSTEGSYVGYEKYLVEYTDSIKFNDAALVGILVFSLAAHLESIRVTRVTRTMSLSHAPWAPVIAAICAGMVARNVVVDFYYESWREKALFYRDLAQLKPPFNLGPLLTQILALVVAVATMGLRGFTVLRAAGIVTLCGTIGVYVTMLTPIIGSLSRLKQETSKEEREGVAVDLLARVHQWNLILCVGLVAASFLLLVGDRFVREVSEEEAAAIAKEREEKKKKREAELEKKKKIEAEKKERDLAARARRRNEVKGSGEGGAAKKTGGANNPARKAAEQKKGPKKRKDMDKAERATFDMWADLKTD